jgi:hypothetical protein
MVYGRIPPTNRPASGMPESAGLDRAATFVLCESQTILSTERTITENR